MKPNYLSKFIVAALLLSGTSIGVSLSMQPVAAQQQLVAMADPTAMVTLCFRMSPRTTDMDKQAVVNFLTQQGFTQVGFRPNGYECIGMGTCADAMRVMKSQLYVAQLTLSNQMVLAYRFDPLPQNPKELMNKARYANVSEAPGYGSGGYSSGMTGGGSGTGNGGYQTGNGYGGSQQGGVQQGGGQPGGGQQGGGQQGGYQYGSGQGELGNGQIGSPPGQQYVRTGSDFGNTGGGSGNQGGSGFGNQGTGYGNQGTGYGNQNTGYGNQNTGYGNQNSNSPYGNTNPQTMTGYSGGGSTPIWNKTDGTLSRDGQGNPQVWKTTNYSNNGTLNNTGLFPNSGGASPGSAGNGNMGTGSQSGGGNGSRPNPNTGNSGGSPNTPAYNPNTPTSNPNTPASNPNTPAYNPNAPAYNPNAPAYNPNAPAYNPNAPANDPTLGPPIQGTAGPPN